MKEKRVDILLAEAGLYHAPLIGFGGTFLNELIQNEPRRIAVTVGGLMFLLLFFTVRNHIVKAKAITRKSKKISHHD